MRKIILGVVLCLLVVKTVYGEIPETARAQAKALPSREVEILLSVGQEYGFGSDKLKLLLAIRKIENGGSGLEMGVESDYPRHRSHRFAGNLDRSLRLQAQWAAGTIRRYYTGDLDAFAKRYCPPKWHHWSNMARHWMSRE